MTALFDRFHNFILSLTRGEDGVCACTCGSDQVYHVVPYNGGRAGVDSSEIYFLSDIMTRQEKDVIVGLLLGLCISWFLLWLDSVWHSELKCWRTNQMTDGGFWSRMPKFSFKQLHPKHTKGPEEKQDVHHNVNESIDKESVD
ncbi:transmembrane protein 240-like [Micropterus salmoides]|uniref:transmembrane protein 240-like n=1 Tax=Micropterus salmoides TaxID=27706 RepID=UPI0018EAAD65|nr:transmembrane protein 240-like [Micropterus salmoides]